MLTNTQLTIYLDHEAHKHLKNDIRLFKLSNCESEIIKKIIVNHYPHYNSDLISLKKTVNKSVVDEINNTTIDDQNCSNIVWNILKFLGNQSITRINNNKIKRDKINIRINKNDYDFELIIDSCPSDATESAYLSNIIYSYLEKPQNERERILFKKTVDEIEAAIKNKQQIIIKNKQNKKIQTINPWKICISKEELYNYLIYQSEQDKAVSIHIYNIETAMAQPNRLKFSEKIKKYFLRMETNGVQFSINDDITYKVKLTETGKYIFEKRYLERPVPLEKSDLKNGILYFNCSEMQLENYFAPFYENAIVLEPKTFRNNIKNKLEETINAYKQ